MHTYYMKWKYCIWNAFVNINRYFTVKKVVRDYFSNIKNITKHNRVKLYNNSFIFKWKNMTGIIIYR